MTNNLIFKSILSLKSNGIKQTIIKIIDYICIKLKIYSYKKLFFISKKELNIQKSIIFPKKIKISIITPLYNTPKRFLCELIKSVKNQTYGNWELCFADGSDSDYDYIIKICEKYIKNDKRIKYKKLDKNYGISGNTNECYSLASGEYLCFLDHKDLLTPNALYETVNAICEYDAELIYCDEDKMNKYSTRFFEPCFKPDYAPDYLRSINYIKHFLTIDKKLIERIDNFKSKFDGAQDYDFILRASEQTNKIIHIPKILYHFRYNKVLNKNNEYKTIEAGRRAVEKHLERISLNGTVEALYVPGTYRIHYNLTDTPLVSIIIPNKDHINDLDKCLKSIKEKTTYKNYEILIIENNSKDNTTFEYYEKLKNENNIKVIKYDEIFNYSKINNYAVKFTNGTQLIFLNNDTEVITPNWIEEMLMYSQRKDVGIVSAKLYYPDYRIQHAGSVLGLNAIVDLIFYNYKKEDQGYLNRLITTQNYNAVIGACLMIEKKLFLNVNGFNEEFVIAFNDSDLCLKVREKGLLVVWTPFCELFHYEGTSRGCNDTPEKKEIEYNERALFNSKWNKYWVNGDPYYNINLSKYNKYLKLI